EDGIRDRNVTGVQTCALPILHLTSYSVLGAASLEATLHATQLARINAAVTSLDIGLAPVRLARQSVTQLAAEMRVLMPSEQVSRSEERRVGKEGRLRRGDVSE